MHASSSHIPDLHVNDVAFSKSPAAAARTALTHPDHVSLRHAHLRTVHSSATQSTYHSRPLLHPNTLLCSMHAQAPVERSIMQGEAGVHEFRNWGALMVYCTSGLLQALTERPMGRGGLLLGPLTSMVSTGPPLPLRACRTLAIAWRLLEPATGKRSVVVVVERPLMICVALLAEKLRTRACITSTLSRSWHPTVVKVQMRVWTGNFLFTGYSMEPM